MSEITCKNTSFYLLTLYSRSLYNKQSFSIISSSFYDNVDNHDLSSKLSKTVCMIDAENAHNDHRMASVHAILRRFNQEEDELLSHISTGDET